MRKLDIAVKDLGLDKDRWRYFDASRLNDTTNRLIEVTVQGNRSKISSGQAGYNNDLADAWNASAMGKIFEFVFVPNIKRVKSFEFFGNIRDQEWGNMLANLH